MNKKIKERLRKEGRTLKTFNQWESDGYKIIKGEKSLCRTEHGVALFTDLQTFRVDSYIN